MPGLIRTMAAVCVVVAGATAHGAVFVDAAAAREAVLDGSVAMSPDDRASALELLKAEAERSPKDARTLLALVVVCEASNDWETGLPVARTLAKMAPDVAEHQYRLGNGLFATIDEVSMINKGARASAGRRAYERAVELDPKHLGARQGLFFFFVEAPGFAGGSVKKAEAIARELIAEEGNAGLGYSLLLRVHRKNEDWGAFNETLSRALAVTPVEDAEQRGAVLLSAMSSVLMEAKDYALGLELAQEYREIAGEGPGGYYASYFEGMALKGLERFVEAAERFETVLRVEPEARNTRWLIAECYEATGDEAEAARHYGIFAEKFPEDDRAKRARRFERKLGGG